jgi:hypothetical protein
MKETTPTIDLRRAALLAMECRPACASSVAGLPDLLGAG